MPEKIVIIGGGQAGGRVAQLLANSSATLDIKVIGQEPYPPYNRPPLSKGVLMGSAGFEDCAIWSKDTPAQNPVTLQSGMMAETIDVEAQIVTLNDGSQIIYDKLVIATGSRTRRMTVPGADLNGVHQLRSFDDALAIAKEFQRGKRLVVVGGGFIGLEIAAAARSRGLETCVIEATDRLLSRVVAKDIGISLAKYHEENGVTFRTGCMVNRFNANRNGALRSVELSNGEVFPCDLAIVGVGVSPNTELARAAGLDGQVGITTDSQLRTSVSNIYACGDVACFWHPLYQSHIRVEAWQNAEEHARVVAKNICGEPAICDAVPFFWSDQYDLAVQVVGLSHHGVDNIRYVADGAQILYHLTARGRLIGATGLGPANKIGRYIRVASRLIAAKAHPDPASLRAGMQRIADTA